MGRWNTLNRLGSYVLIADGFGVLAIWGVAAVIGGTVAERVAELITLLAVANAVRRLIPRGRPDEPYLTTLRLRPAKAADPGLSPRPAKTGPVGRRVALVLIVGGALAVQAQFPHAPATDELPVGRFARVIASAAGGSQVDTSSDHTRYRYMAIAGRVGQTGSALLAAERMHVIKTGWQCTTTKLIYLHPHGERTELVPHRCSPTQPRSSAALISPDQSLELYLDAVTSQADADQFSSGSSLAGNFQISHALRDRRPVLWVQMAYRP